MNNNLLPIGTVIKTYNNEKEYIIMGTYFKKGNERFTYYCCLYPYGFLLNPGPIKESIPYYEIYVNQKDIEKIVFLGNIN